MGRARGAPWIRQCYFSLFVNSLRPGFGPQVNVVDVEVIL